MPCSAWTKTPLFSMYPLCFVHDDSQTEKFLLYNPQSRLSERITSPHPFRVRSPLPPFTRTLAPRSLDTAVCTILNRRPRHGACAVGAVNTSVHCAESYGIGPLLQQGMSARISHGGRKRGPRRARSNIIWIGMDTYGDIHCNLE